MLPPEQHAPARTIRFVGFVNEEPRYFWNAEMGSLVYAKACKAHGDVVVAMLRLETLGYYRAGAATQKYPLIVSWFYPDRADFIASDTPETLDYARLARVTGGLVAVVKKLAE